jgi:glycosyltransferase involved in cell wall biosynthesis
MQQLRVLAPTRYPWTFNGPRHSQHIIERRSFMPFDRISKSIEATTVFNPLPPRRFDLIHAFNRIPLAITPFVIGFESHLPRAYGLERTTYFRRLSNMLSGGRCRAIVAISEHARKIFRETHDGRPGARDMFDKLCIRYPNVDVPDGEDLLKDDLLERVRVTFIGSHFGRKGGCVAVELARNAIAAKFPLDVVIVSSLQVGGSIWTDPASPKFFEKYFSLLELPNVRHYASLDNPTVIDLLRQSHFGLLATFGDTFGFTAIEALANSTPVIATNQCALPEFIVHRKNGILLDLPTNSHGEWIHSSSPRRATEGFEKIFSQEVSRLARQALGEIMAATQDAKSYQLMRRAAKDTALRLFGSRAASRYWDSLYAGALDGTTPIVA